MPSDSIADARLHPTVQRHPLPDRQPITYLVTNAGASDALYAPAQVVKIGTTVDLPGRMLRMQTRRPGVRLRLVCWLPGGEEVEGGLHRQFGHLRVGASGDWFWVADEPMDDLVASGTVEYAL